MRRCAEQGFEFAQTMKRRQTSGGRNIRQGQRGIEMGVDEIPRPIQSPPQFFTRCGAEGRESPAFAKRLILRFQHAIQKLSKLLFHPQVRQWAALMGPSQSANDRGHFFIVGCKSFEKMRRPCEVTLRPVEKSLRRRCPRLERLLGPASREENDE